MNLIAIILITFASLLAENTTEYPGITEEDITFYELYKHENNTGKAAEYAEIFLMSIDSTISLPHIIEAEEYLANYYETEVFSFSRAIRWRERTLRHYISNEDKDGVAKTTYLLAGLYYNKGIYHKSLQYANMAKDWYEHTEDTENCLECYNILGVLYQICKDYEKSSEYLNMYLSGVRKLKDSTKLSKALNNMAVAAYLEKDTIRIEGILKQSLDIAKSTGDTSLLASIYMNHANQYLRNNKAKIAARYLDSAQMYVKKTPEFGKLHFLKGVCSLYNNDTEKVISNLNKAISYYRQGEFELKEQECLMLLHNILYQTNKFKDAYLSLRRYHQIEQTKAGSDVFLELFRAENKIQLADEREKMSERQTMQATLFSSGIILLIIILFIISHILRNKSFQIKQNEAELTTQRLMNESKEQEIRSKNEILEIKKMQQFRMNKISEEITKRLGDLGRETRDEKTKQHIRSIIRDISGLTDQEQWKEISNFIPEFNSEFSKNLLKAHPDLSINERRLCSLLNLNMTTKEISEITRQSTAGINKARTRLRNKLGLTGNDTSIQEYLSTFNENHESA